VRQSFLAEASRSAEPTHILRQNISQGSFVRPLHGRKSCRMTVLRRPLLSYIRWVREAPQPALRARPGVQNGARPVNKLSLVGVTLLAAIAVDAVLHLPQILHPGLHPAARYAEVFGRGLGLFLMGWVVAGAVYFISGRNLPRETLAWTVVGVSVVAAVLARIG
jgi:hypothetical protein